MRVRERAREGVGERERERGRTSGNPAICILGLPRLIKILTQHKKAMKISLTIVKLKSVLKKNEYPKSWDRLQQTP